MSLGKNPLTLADSTAILDGSTSQIPRLSLTCIYRGGHQHQSPQTGSHVGLKETWTYGVGNMGIFEPRELMISTYLNQSKSPKNWW